MNASVALRRSILSLGGARSKATSRSTVQKQSDRVARRAAQTSVFGSFNAVSKRFNATTAYPSFKATDLSITRTKTPKEKTPNEKLVFGRYFSDHMLEVDWDEKHGWGKPVISPYHKLELDPSASVLHYAIECFEGMKAYKDKDGKVRLFRPLENMKRLNTSAARCALPTFDEKELLECIKQLVKVDEDFIPQEPGFSLYLRPTVISTSASLGVHVPRTAKLFVLLSPVGPYYPTGFKPVSLYADPNNVRAWPGGTGGYKMGCNYAVSIMPAMEASQMGYQQILWLLDDYVTEVGTMNVFVFWKNEKGERELVTPPLNHGGGGIILPGITRKSILELTREWNEFKVVEKDFKMADLARAVQEGRVMEIFGAGTAAIVSPVERIHYKGQDYKIPLGLKPTNTCGELAQRLADEIQAIQYGEKSHEWSVTIQ